MRIFNLVIGLFILSAFAIGVASTDTDRVIVDNALSNVSATIYNITLKDSALEERSIPNVEGFLSVLEKYIHFLGGLMVEVMRAGVYFGQENPEHFDPETIIYFGKWIVWLVLIALLIKPIGYLVIFITLSVMFIVDKIKHKKIVRKDKGGKHERRKETRKENRR